MSGTNADAPLASDGLFLVFIGELLAPTSSSSLRSKCSIAAFARSSIGLVFLPLEPRPLLAADAACCALFCSGVGYPAFFLVAFFFFSSSESSMNTSSISGIASLAYCAASSAASSTDEFYGLSSMDKLAFLSTNVTISPGT